MIKSKLINKYKNISHGFFLINWEDIQVEFIKV